MTDLETSFEHFVTTCLKPVLPTRAYLLNKPCSRCHRGSNIRVNKPTCSHRICSTCLAEFDSRHDGGEPVSCSICSTYWFTPQPGATNPHDSELDSVEWIGKRRDEIDRSICGELGSDYHNHVYLVNENAEPQSGIYADALKVGDDDSLRGGLSRTSSPAKSKDLTSEDLEQQALRVREQWKASCTGQTTTGEEFGLRKSHGKATQEAETSQNISNKDNETENPDVLEFEATGSVSSSSDGVEDLDACPTDDENTQCAQEMSINPLRAYRVDTNKQHQQGEGSIWPVLSLVAACFALNYAAAALIRSLLGGRS